MKILSKEEAIEYCCKSGRQFIELFKRYFKSLDSEKRKEIIKEMQIKLNYVNNIILIDNKKKLYHSNKMDWFFTATSSYDDFFSNENMKELYDKFILSVEETKDIKTAFNDIQQDIYFDDLKYYKTIVFFDIFTTGLNIEKDKIIKLDYIKCDNCLNIISNACFFNDNKENETFMTELLQSLIKEKYLIVVYDKEKSFDFIKQFLTQKNLKDIFNNTYILDLKEVFVDNSKIIDNFNFSDIVKFYNINQVFNNSNISNYPILLKEMLKTNSIRNFIKYNKN
ncbi:MAG: ribonuclease H-like domain-containing protein [Christensenellales bacterium]